MQVITPDLIKDQKILLRLDLDVPLRYAQGKPFVADDFRLRVALPTIRLCLENASEVIIMGHIGRPQGKEVPELSVVPIYNWLEDQGLSSYLTSGKLKLLENLRFEEGEENCSLEYAKALASLGAFYVNEAFAAHHPAASMTVLPTLLPHACGLRFAEEVSTLTRLREAPRPGLVAIIGGAKVEDKLPVVLEMAKRADWVLVGGKIASEVSEHLRGVPQAPHHLGGGILPPNVLLSTLNKERTDITEETVLEWEPIIKGAKTIVWNGPLGKVEEEKNDKSRKIAQIILGCQVFSVVGGGDTVGFLDKFDLLDKFSFVSTGGGAMLKFLAEGTLPTTEALK